MQSYPDITGTQEYERTMNYGYPYIPRCAYCDCCGAEFSGDYEMIKAGDGRYICQDCAFSFISENFNFMDIAKTLGFEIVEAMNITDENHGGCYEH